MLAQGLTPQKDEPFVKLRLRDSPKTRALWKHSFELQYTVTLGVKQLGLHLSVCNTGKTNMEFCTSLHTHIGVSDLASGSVKLLVRLFSCDGSLHTAAGSAALTSSLHARTMFAGLARRAVRR